MIITPLGGGPRPNKINEQAWVKKFLSERSIFEPRAKVISSIEKRLQKSDSLVIRPATAPPMSMSGGDGLRLVGNVQAPDDQFSKMEKKIISILNSLLCDPKSFASRMLSEYNIPIKHESGLLLSNMSVTKADVLIKDEDLQISNLQQELNSTHQSLSLILQEREMLQTRTSSSANVKRIHKNQQQQPRDESEIECNITQLRQTLTEIESQLPNKISSRDSLLSVINSYRESVIELNNQSPRKKMTYSRGLSLIARSLCINQSRTNVSQYGAPVGKMTEIIVTIDRSFYDISPFGIVVQIVLNSTRLRELFKNNSHHVIGCGWRRHPQQPTKIIVSILTAVAFLDSLCIRNRSHLPLQSVGHQVGNHISNAPSSLPVQFLTNCVSAVSPTEHPVVCGNVASVVLWVASHYEISMCVVPVGDDVLTVEPLSRVILDKDIFLQESGNGTYTAHIRFRYPGRHCLHVFARKSRNLSSNSSVNFDDMIFKPIGYFFFDVDNSLWDPTKASVHFVKTMPIMSTTGAVLMSPIRNPLEKNKSYEFCIEIGRNDLNNQIQNIERQLLQSTTTSETDESSASSSFSFLSGSSFSVEAAAHNQELSHLRKRLSKPLSITLQSTTKCMPIPLETESSNRYTRRILINETGELLLMINASLVLKWDVVK